MPETSPAHSAKIHRDAIRYMLSGGGAAAVDLCTYALLTGVAGMSPESANLVSRPMGGLASFLLHKYVTFENRGRDATHVQFGRFWVVWFLTFGISQALVVFYHQVVGFSPFLTKISAEGGAGLVSFLCQRHWTFR